MFAKKCRPTFVDMQSKNVGHVPVLKGVGHRHLVSKNDNKRLLTQCPEVVD